MADLSTILTTDPPASEASGNGAFRIQETRDAIVTSFSGADVGTGSTQAEHYKKGFHKFLSGAPAALPTPGNNGRIFFDTTNQVVMRDNGTTWTMAGAVTVSGAVKATNTVIGTTYTDIVSLTLTPLTGARIFIFGSVPAEIGASGRVLTFTITPPGTPTGLLVSQEIPMFLSFSTGSIDLRQPLALWSVYLTGIVAGSYKLQGKIDLGSTTVPSGGSLVALQI